MPDLAHLTSELPDPEAARRFLAALEQQRPSDAAKLQKNDGLLSDVLALAAYSPLLSTTLLQNPDYLWWLNRKRRAPAVRTKDELLEALGRFVLTHTGLDLHTQLARFRRRELLRIFLSDIRRLATIAEVTEDISNLADAILETALRDARQEMDNRYGQPQAIDEKGRRTFAEFSIVSLGKLGSRELNYSSDIDLLFLYSDDGETSGRGTRGKITNREYFVKLGETVGQIVGKQGGEGAAYRVDMRLRPHGRVGPLAISLADAVRYYTSEARDWERQVLIRSRASAGDVEIYKRFFEQVRDSIFILPIDTSHTSHVYAALENVRQSKALIDRELKAERGFNVKLGSGGIREIEFIAQALQLSYGGSDEWLRAAHTLISLSRLSDRGLIFEAELTDLFNAYDFLRRLEHILQMENGLQTHSIPDDPQRRSLVARRMRCENVHDFDAEVRKHTGNVHSVFERVFGRKVKQRSVTPASKELGEDRSVPPVLEERGEHRSAPPGSEERGEHRSVPPGLEERREHRSVPTAIAGGAALDNESTLVGAGSRPPADAGGTDLWTRVKYSSDLARAIATESDFRHRLGALRREWSQLLDAIRTAELRNEIDIKTAKQAQTALAEASIHTALDITYMELEKKYKTPIDDLALAVMGLGKLGGGSIDYGSDLDLVLVYDPDGTIPNGVTPAEFYSHAAQTLVNVLSSITRDGHLYRVDLRLRPYGKNGTSTISSTAFFEYMRSTAAIWELLAYVKLRAVAGDMRLAERVETEIRRIIHRRAASTDPAELATEARNMRMRLEAERSRTRRSSEVDIKYGPGGLLDIYFAIRFLQLRDGVPDSADNRSTEFVLGVLHEKGSLATENYETLLVGYRFLSFLDHAVRITVGRTTRLPSANAKALEAVAKKMGLQSPAALIEQLTLHRLGIRAAFDNVLATPDVRVEKL